MKNLYQFLTESNEEITQNTESYWDGHVHLFNHKKPIQSIPNIQKRVGFMDLEYDVKNINVIKSYDEYMINHYSKDKDILLVTGTNIEDIKTIYNKYSSFIKGFGELKCYDKYKGQPVPYKKISFVKQVCRFSQQCGNLPVYVHWELNERKDLVSFENLLKTYPDIPIVLCHCGLTKNNSTFAFPQLIEMANKYQNLWFDISYTGLDYFLSNPFNITQLPKMRLIFGTDINNKFEDQVERKEKNLDKCISNFINLQKIFNINNKNNIQTLFSLKGS